MEKCLSASVQQLSPAVGLRLIFETIASGILLPGLILFCIAYNISVEVPFSYFVASHIDLIVTAFGIQRRFKLLYHR